MIKEIKLKLWNCVFSCAYCKTIFDMSKESPNVIMQFVGVVPAGLPGKFQNQMGSLVICDTCFSKHDLMREDIAIATTLPNNPLKKNSFGKN